MKPCNLSRFWKSSSSNFTNICNSLCRLQLITYAKFLNELGKMINGTKSWIFLKGNPIFSLWTSLTFKAIAFLILCLVRTSPVTLAAIGITGGHVLLTHFCRKYHIKIRYVKQRMLKNGPLKFRRSLKMTHSQNCNPNQRLVSYYH